MKSIFILIPFFSGVIFLCSCGGHTSNAYSSTSGWDYGSSNNNRNDLSNDSEFYTESNEIPTQKIIYSAYLYLTVKEPDTTIKFVENLAAQNKGYVSSMAVDRIVIRVKSDFFSPSVAAIEGQGEVTKKNITGNDVSSQYHDYQIRLDNALTSRDRYLALLNDANNVTEALKVEKELERLNLTIEQLKGKMNELNHLEAYSTITVYVSPKRKPGVIGYIGIGVYRGVKWLFVRG